MFVSLQRNSEQKELQVLFDLLIYKLIKTFIMNKSNNIKVLVSKSMDPFKVLETCKNIAANKFGYGVIVRSTPQFKAPVGTARKWFELFGKEMDIVKVTKVTNARAYDYVSAIKRQLEKQGSENTFKGDKMLGYEWLVPNILKASLKEGIRDEDRMQFCITFKRNDKTSFESFYIVDGDHFATDSELAFIREYLKPTYVSKKQTECGIDYENIIMVRNYKVSNVVMCGKTNTINEYWESIIEK